METKNLNVAKIIIITSLTSVIIITGLLYIGRGFFIEYVRTAVITSTEQKTVQPTSTEQVVTAIEKVNAAVVSVIITKDVPVYEQYYEPYNPGGFLGGFSIPRVREKGTKEQEVGGGSGFIVSNDGLIVTNRHVVEDTTARYSVVLNDSTPYKVTVLARDTALDIAILKIDEPLREALTFATFGDSESLRLGETVIAIGNALAEFRNSVSVGVVSGVSRSIIASDGMGRSEQLNQVIQTDAAINPGNSGGPLLNISGEVIGVNVATSRGADNIGFALPASVVKEVVASVKTYGEIIRPFLGVRYLTIDKKIAEENELPVDYGALVIKGETERDFAIIPGSPADDIGIKENDVILSIDGEALREKDLATVLRGKSVGQEIVLVVLQAGVEKELRVKLEKL
ncbi:trypsin-like serine protease [Candidatus Kaiserbacteria bacterium]|nr:trypsin-like serine protease [Candidatus Kaiserbacteria bacterium]NCT01631.1 trypsin-like serine protease [Candidatus Parcubacteria bacterium]